MSAPSSLAMDMTSLRTNTDRDVPTGMVHGFRVQSYGKRLPPGFRRGLKRLAERGFTDPTCVVVKTANGSRSGITHAGGRYVHSDNPYRIEVMAAMRDLGMEPPSPPFIVAPGEYTLYHEWGHHVDRCWSGVDQQITFSFRWFSQFYQLGVRPPVICIENGGPRLNYGDVRPIESSDVHAADALVFWWHASSELFADLFEDWMRCEKKISWDHCEPNNLTGSARDFPCVSFSLLPGVQPDNVRSETYALFAAGLESPRASTPVRYELFGTQTDEIVRQFRDVLLRGEI